MNQIWNTQNTKINPKVLKFTVGQDYILDQDIFLPYDLVASEAHAEMLEQINVLTPQELKKIKLGLSQIKKLYKEGKFKIKPEEEDCHTAIENYLTKNSLCGDKIHTARSRNDQSLTMIRLYLIDSLTRIQEQTYSLMKSLKEWSKKSKNIPMPGYSHMQKAMPTTVSMWIASYAEALSDSMKLLDSTIKILNQSPLGSGAGFGLPIKIDRKFTAEKLQFKKVQENPIYCQFSRGFFESQSLFAVNQIMIILSRLATDLMLYTTNEFNFFKLPKEFTTSSSIMPQKQNYDVFEIIRANQSITNAAQQEIQSIHSKLQSGYARDLQLIKSPLVRGLETANQTIEIALEIMPHLKINEPELKSKMTKEIYATQEAYKLVDQGIPFRKAYGQIKQKSLRYPYEKFSDQRR